MRSRVLMSTAALAVLSLSVLAVTPQFWENFSQDEMLKGTLTRISLSPEGRLYLAPAYDLVYDSTQPYIFSMVRDKAGNTYLGTGHDGKVFKVDAKGNGSVYYESKELDVFALALDASDTLYAGTSPDGKVFKITGANQGSEFCDPEDKYIWSLLFDEAGNLYVGTGGRGIIYKVDRSGKKTTFYDSDDNHIVSLAREGNGNILAGTSPGGLVLQINPQGKAFALLDTSLEEVRALAVDRFGTVFALASSSKGLATSTPAKPETPIEITGGALPIVTIQALSSAGDKSKDSKSTVTAPGGEKDSTGAKSSIFAISKDGSIETIYTSKDSMLYDIVPRADGSLLAATGGKGRLLAIDPSKQVTVITDSPEEQVTRLAADGDTVWVAGSNQGKLYKLQPQRAQLGTFESNVMDAKTVASWGKINWRVSGTSGGSVEISSRAGNTDKPDKSWSDWSAPYTTAAGQPISSPKARYFQWRASFKRGSSPGSYDVLERVQVAYLQQNLRPQVVSITPLPYGVGLQKMPALQTGTLNLTGSTDTQSLNSPRERGRERQALPPRQMLQPGAQSFTWKASDDNDDDLAYSIYFRGEGESDWKQLAKELTDTFYTLDSASLPDGVYTLKVVASDAQSNPFGKSLIGEMVSRPFIISNSTPLIEVTGHKLQGKRVEAQFHAQVSTGRIATGEFSVDGGEWFLVFPSDGIADSAQEEFQFQTPELGSGEHLVGVRASDANGNTATRKIVVKVP